MIIDFILLKLNFLAIRYITITFTIEQRKSINHIQVGSVILYYQYMDIFKIKIYDGITHQIEYFDILRNNITTGKVTRNFLKTGEEILILKNEIFQIWKQNL